jgi:hypothetical protein
MVDITKDAGYIKQTTPEPQFDEKAKKLFSEDFKDLFSIAEKRCINNNLSMSWYVGYIQMGSSAVWCME